MPIQCFTIFTKKFYEQSPQDKFGTKGVIILWLFAYLLLAPLLTMAIEILTSRVFIENMSQFFTPAKLDAYHYGNEPAMQIIKGAFYFLAVSLIVLSAALSTKFFAQTQTIAARICNDLWIFTGALLTLGIIAPLTANFAFRYLLAGYTPLRVA